MRKAIVAAVGTAVFAVPTAGAGGDREVVRRGQCTGASTWKLKAKLDDGRIEVEYEVDQNRLGRRWRVTLRRNGAVTLRTVRRTRPPSGSFEVRRLIRNGPGRERIRAHARALATGEVCRGALRF